MCKGKILLVMGASLLVPFVSGAQDPSGSIYSLHNVLEGLLEEMIPLCRRLIDVGRAIAGFAALWYIAIRVWRHLARAEAIDFFPLLRPFAIGMAIALFPSLISLMNDLLEPTVAATAAMSQDSQKAIIYHLAEREKAVKDVPPPVGIYPGDTADGMEKYEETDGAGIDFFSTLRNAIGFFSITSMFKVMISELVQILYATAGLAINTVRTFYLVVLAILGPLVLALSVFDGFQHTLPSWLARYINVYMWLPVANLFGAITSKILENMIVLDQNFFSTTAYVIFMIISIIGYTTVPNVAGYIVQAGGRDTLLHKVNSMTKTAGKAAAVALI